MRTKLLLLAATFAMLASCGTDKGDKTYKLEVPTSNRADVRSLMTSFDDAWNRKDSAALLNLFADDVVLISGKERYSGKNELAGNWLRTNLPVTSNLRINDVKNDAGNEIAYSAGTWNLDVNVPGREATSSAGNHTFVWKRVADNVWKLSFINIEDYSSPQQ